MAKARTFPTRFLILGATSAIATAVCERLAAKGARFFLVARNPSKLDAVRKDLLTRGAENVDTFIADLDDTSLHSRILKAGEESLSIIEVALIAHGVLGDQQKAEADY